MTSGQIGTIFDRRIVAGQPVQRLSIADENAHRPGAERLRQMDRNAKVPGFTMKRLQGGLDQDGVSGVGRRLGGMRRLEFDAAMPGQCIDIQVDRADTAQARGVAVNLDEVLPQGEGRADRGGDLVGGRDQRREVQIGIAVDGDGAAQRVGQFHAVAVALHQRLIERNHDRSRGDVGIIDDLEVDGVLCRAAVEVNA